MNNIKIIALGDGLRMVGGIPEGSCEECATEHKAEMPHNQTSLFYQYKFHAENGHWPTWTDAMEHCTDEAKEMWRAELKNHGIDLGKEKQ